MWILAFQISEVSKTSQYLFADSDEGYGGTELRQRENIGSEHKEGRIGE